MLTAKNLYIKENNMVTLLAKHFIPNYDNTKSPNVRHSYGMLCGIVGILLNVLLFTGKFLAGFFSHSIAITADAFNNLSDAGSSFITLAGFKLASQKPDPDHPYGHGRMEYLSGLFVSLLILLMAVELLKTSVDKILNPQDTLINPVVITILIASILVKIYMSYYNQRIGEKIDSAALLATATDSRGDSISTLLVLISSLFSFFTGIQIDGWCGLLVGIFILYSGFTAAKDTINPLLGQAPDKEYVEEIERIVTSHDLILGIHDMMVHDYGPGRVVVSLHAEVPSDGDLLEMHDLIDHIEQDLANMCHCEAVIHMDPIAVNDPEVDSLKVQIGQIITSIDSELKFHDFRIVKGPTHTNLIFDVLVPYRFAIGDNDLIDLIDTKVKEVNPTYFIVVKIDHTYI